MPKLSTQLLILMMLLLAFIGQVTAMSVPACAEESSLVDSSAATEINTHISDIKNAETKESDCCSTVCCDLGCLCLVSNCTSVVFVSTDFPLNQHNITTDVIGFSETLVLDTSKSLVYRPPIFA